MYDSIFITAPKNEFVIWEEILNIVASSLEFTDTFLNGFNRQQDAVMKNFQSIRNICVFTIFTICFKAYAICPIP